MIFSSDDSQWAQQVSVNAGRFQIYVAKCAWPPSSNPTATLIWGTWKCAANLKLDSVFVGSSIAGMSYAHISLANGAPLQNPQVDVEEDVTINFGDRVYIQGIIGSGQTAQTNPIFAGYVVGGDLGIDPDRESLRFKVVGPEWLWGGDGGPMVGSANPVVGQLRRQGSEDDYYMKHTTTEEPVVTAFNGLYLFTTDRTRFNPDGQRNATIDNVTLATDTNNNPILGPIFESPERFTGGTLRVAAWNANAASQMLELWFNDPAVTGIAHPAWTNADGSPNPQLDATTPLPDVDVDTDGLWDALRKVAGPNWAFYVDPRPGNQGGGAFKPTGTSWGPFTIRWFQRGIDIDGTQVDAYLNERGTPSASAIASVQRLQASKSIEKTVTRVDVYARITRSITLYYYGLNTPQLATLTSNTTDHADPYVGVQPGHGNVLLQHGWTLGEFNPASYAGTIANAGGTPVKVVTPDTIAASGAGGWQSNYCTDGQNFSGYRHCGRLFVWNEDGNYNTTASSSADLPSYVGTTMGWYAPILTGIADGEGPDAGYYCRRPRKLLDTPVPDSGNVDSWRKISPQLYLGNLAFDSDGNPLANVTVRVPASHYRVDPQRCAVWITAPNLATWQPFIGGANINGNGDARSFATLLLTGQFCMFLEGCIETDCVCGASATRQAIAGSPFSRRAIVRKERQFTKSEVLIGSNGNTSSAYLGWATATGQPTQGLNIPGYGFGPNLDTSPQAQDLANQLQNAGQDQQTHCSILFSADWPLQGIGKVLSTIAGRTVNLTGGPSGRGAQVVALHLDPAAMKWEMLTETAAMAMRRKHQSPTHAAMKRAMSENANAADAALHTGSPNLGDQNA